MFLLTLMRLTLPDSPTRPVTNHFSKLMNKVDKERTRKKFGVVKRPDLRKNINLYIFILIGQIYLCRLSDSNCAQLLSFLCEPVLAR